MRLSVRVSDYIQFPGGIFLVLTPILGVVTAGFFLYYANSHSLIHSRYLNLDSLFLERLLGPIFLCFFGGLFQLGWAAFDFTGRKGFPCALLSTLTLSTVTLNMAPLTIRYAAFHFRVVSNKRLAQIQLSQAFKKNQKYYEKLFNEKDQDLAFVDAEPSSEVKSNPIQKIASLTESLQSREIIDKSLKRALFFSSPRFANISCVALIVITIIGSLILLHRKDVGGCHFPCDKKILGFDVMYALAVPVAITSSIFLWKDRKEPDPLKIKIEASILMSVGCSTGLLSTVPILASDDIFFRPRFSVALFWMVGVLVIILVQFLVPLYLIRKESKDRKKNLLSSSDDLSLTEILNSETGLHLFQAFSISEFSMENLAFYIDALAWKKLAGKEMTPKRLNTVKKMRDMLISTFVESTAPFEINVSGEIRANVIAKMENDSVDVDLFDECINETFGLMRGDTLTRFKQTDEYRSLLSSTIDQPVP